MALHRADGRRHRPRHRAHPGARPVKRTPVLIVGAGAVGTVLGHHLRLSGAEVTHLVRPGRAQAHAA
ncbi:2-dehydropantoate 2-reductase N-terminal domain-containing protein, partial [Actinosynnema sp.]